MLLKYNFVIVLLCSMYLHHALQNTYIQSLLNHHIVCGLCWVKIYLGYPILHPHLNLNNLSKRVEKLPKSRFRIGKNGLLNGLISMKIVWIYYGLHCHQISVQFSTYGKYLDQIRHPSVRMTPYISLTYSAVFTGISHSCVYTTFPRWQEFFCTAENTTANPSSSVYKMQSWTLRPTRCEQHSFTLGRA